MGCTCCLPEVATCSHSLTLQHLHVHSAAQHALLPPHTRYEWHPTAPRSTSRVFGHVIIPLLCISTHFSQGRDRGRGRNGRKKNKKKSSLSLRLDGQASRFFLSFFFHTCVLDKNFFPPCLWPSIIETRTFVPLAFFFFCHEKTCPCNSPFPEGQ